MPQLDVQLLHRGFHSLVAISFRKGEDLDDRLQVSRRRPLLAEQWFGVAAGLLVGAARLVSEVDTYLRPESCAQSPKSPSVPPHMRARSSRGLG